MNTILYNNNNMTKKSNKTPSTIDEFFPLIKKILKARINKIKNPGK